MHCFRRVGLWSSSLVQFEPGRLLLLGGKTLGLGGEVDYIFEYNEYFGFKLLDKRLPSPRYSMVAAVASPSNMAMLHAAGPGTAPAYSNLPEMLFVGSDDLSKPTSEVLSFSKTRSAAARNLPEFPAHLIGATGEKLKDNSVLVCGGNDVKTKRRSAKCYKLGADRKQWEEAASLAKARRKAASILVQTKASGGEDTMWVLGGESDERVEKTSEMLVKGEWVEGPLLPKNYGFQVWGFITFWNCCVDTSFDLKGSLCCPAGQDEGDVHRRQPVGEGGEWLHRVETDVDLRLCRLSPGVEEAGQPQGEENRPRVRSLPKGQQL